MATVVFRPKAAVQPPLGLKPCTRSALALSLSGLFLEKSSPERVVRNSVALSVGARAMVRSQTRAGVRRSHAARLR